MITDEDDILTAVDAVANMKGWTIVHGVSNLYKVKYTPAPYFNTYNSAGRKWYARSTGIVDDTSYRYDLRVTPNPIHDTPLKWLLISP